MAIDLTGRLSESREFVWAECPDDPELRESVNVWVWDDSVTFGLPRIGIEAVAAHWEDHEIQGNIAFADGRVLATRSTGKRHDAHGADDRPRILGAGPLSFELLEPFRHWRVHYDGTLPEMSVEAQMAGEWPDPSKAVPVQLELDIRHAVPPWQNGSLSAEAARVLAEQEEGDLMGGPRYEQLFRATGKLRVGDQVRELSGGGLRIRRQGIRRLAKFRGHVWQSGLFPSGRAFGCLVYPPRADGKPTYNEAFLFEGDGELIPARVVDAPWLRRLEVRADVSVVLETADGASTRIRGESAASTFSVINATAGDFPILQQAIVRFSWDGEMGAGMTERSMPPDRVTRP